MTIAELIKYIDSLKSRQSVIKQAIDRVQLIKVWTKVVAHTADWQVEETTSYAINPKALMSEYDETAKELRLAQATLERLNHTTETNFVAKF